MKITVHIGLPKTGSTSLQNWLNANRSELSQQGIGYQRIKVEGHGVRHSQLEIAVCQFDRAGKLFPNQQVRRVLGFRDLDGQARFAAQFTAQFRDWLTSSQHQHVVISSEHIGAATKSVRLAKALDQWLSQWFDQRHYVVYFRRQEDWLLSNYSQSLRAGSTDSLDAYLTQSNVSNYAGIANLWADTVGRDNITVRLLERDALLQGDLISDFAALIRADETSLTRPVSLNEAYGAKAAAYVRQLNMWLAKHDPNPGAPRWRALKSDVQQLAGNDRKLALSADQCARIRDRFAAQNDDLRRAFFPDRPILFPARDKHPAAQSPELTPQDQAEITARLKTETRTGGPLVQQFLQDMSRGVRE